MDRDCEAEMKGISQPCQIGQPARTSVGAVLALVRDGRAAGKVGGKPTDATFWIGTVSARDGGLVRRHRVDPIHARWNLVWGQLAP